MIVCFVVFKASGRGGFGFCRDFSPVGGVVSLVIAGISLLVMFAVVSIPPVCFLHHQQVTGMKAEVAKA